MKMKTKLIVAFGAMVALLAGFSSAAYAANGAAPGDTLYGFDCALENVGIGDGGLQERLAEAAHLAECGLVNECLNHAALAIRNQAGLEEGGPADAALVAAANAVQATNQGESTEIRNRVAEMVQWMATNQAHSEGYGQGVTERAEEISGACEQHQEGQLEQNQNQEQSQYQEQEQNGGLNQNGTGGGAR